MFENLIITLSAKVDLSKEDIAICKNYFVPILFSKNNILEEANEIPKYLYFINKGYVRLFRYNEKGEEVTTQINSVSTFITSYKNFIDQSISEENLECITDCELLKISRKNIESAFSQSSRLKDFCLRNLRDDIVAKDNRSLQLATLSAKERYEDLISNNPGLINHVPLQHIASFLGLKPESLSRIRKNIIS